MIEAALILAGGLSIAFLVLLARYLEGRAWRASLLAVELHLPYGLAPDDINRWLNTVAAATHAPRAALLHGPPLGLELIANDQGIRHVLLVPKSLRATALAGLRASLPGIRLTELPDYLDIRPRCVAGAEAVLSNPRRQMSVERAEGTAMAVLATLQPLAQDQTVVVQWIMTGAGTPEPVGSLTPSPQENFPAWLAGEELTDGESIRQARLKVTDALLHAVIRVGVGAPSMGLASATLNRVWGQLRGLNAPGVLLHRRWWLGLAWVASRLQRLAVPVTTWPLLLSTREATGLLPIPVGEVALPGLRLGLARQLPPPPGMPEVGVQLGVSNYPDIRTPIRLAVPDRLHHLHVLGPTGVGKSTLLARLILQDIAAGHGVVVIDPKSDLVQSILERVPEHRAGDIIVADASSTERPVGFNILGAAHDEQSRELVVDHVIHIWHEIYKDFWGPRSEDVLRGALLSLINTKGANGEAFTLIETPELLMNTPFRKFVTEQAGVPAGLQSFWAWYRGMLPSDRLKVIGPILNKLRASTLRTPIRLMLGQSQGLDLDRILAEKRILLVPLSAGTLGAETASLLGTVLLAALWQAILGRVALAATDRHPVFVYIDEAQSVLNLPVDLADMLAQARGLGAGFTLAHQHLGQIDDKQVKSALLGTVRSQIVYSLMREDAATLAPSYAPRLTADDLMGLSTYEIAARLCVLGQTLAPLTATTLPLPPRVRDGAALADTSRQRYGRPRAEVEAALKVRSQPPDEEEAAGSQTKDDARGKGKAGTFGRRRKPSGETGAAS